MTLRSTQLLFRRNPFKRLNYSLSTRPQHEMASSLKPAAAHSLLHPTGDSQISNAIYLDVRMPDEFKNGHAPGAINIPVTMGGMKVEPSFTKDVKEKIGDDKHIIVGCKSGKRSSMAISVLLADGFEASRLTNLDGGFDAWTTTEGLPVEM